MTHQISYHKTISRCIHCESEDFFRRGETSLGYYRYYCNDCCRFFNERTKTQFNYLEFPTDVVFLVIRWYFRYKLSLRDLPEMMMERGLNFSHETVRRWAIKFGPMLINELRKKRKNRAGESWYVDETAIKVKGKQVWLYRAIDRNGNLVDCMLSEKRDMKATKRFFHSASKVTNRKPARVTTDSLPSYPKAIRETLGKRVFHRVNGYLHNFTEQSHRGVKARFYVTLGFGNKRLASILMRGFDELKNFFRPKTPRKLSAKQMRGIRASKIYSLQKMVENF